MKPDLELIRALVDLVEREILEELVYQKGEVRITVRRTLEQQAETSVVAKTAVGPAPAPARFPPEPHKLLDEENKARRDLFSPMSGVLYRGPSPAANPFVEVGDFVEEGQTVALVEAMKTFNEVGAEFAGRIAEIYVKNEETVAAGQPILAIESLEGDMV